VILRSYREHRQSPDDTFLQRNYGRIKQAMTYLMKMDAEDGALNGMIEGRQHNTLDADWYGKIPAIASLYLCALKAMARMAEHTGDTAFAKECERLFALGQPLYENLFDGDYFIQEVDMEHASAIGTGTGCYIDQVIGVWWAHQLGLSPLFDQEKVHSALRSLWRYNFVPDIGTFREHFKAGRWYAMDDESGMIMCSWPKGGANPAWRDNWQFMYFNECMTGFEWQVAGHFLWEGMVTEGMALSRAIHDRYRASRRNPYNEIECSDHYARAMASYGTFLAACGFEYSGPEGRLGFSPAWNKEYFKAAFTTSEGWGTYEQNLHESGATITIALKYGCLHPRSLKLGSMAHLQIDQVTAFLDENKIDVAPQKDAPSVLLFSDCVELLAGQTLRFEIHF
jgi:non-lysosomal glucosylceramidase